MIERAIENWLTKTNERNYQAPFCQVLLHKGHKVIYVSSHRSMEQGKDIITVDNAGNPCAYQLKTGDIDLKKWRDILGEVKELIELPIIHPSVDKSKRHKSFLVMNGEITDEVRIQIDQINEDNQRKERKYSYLDIIDGKMLLKEFVDAQGKFIPKELSDFNLFLNIYLSDGTGFFPKGKYFSILDNTILVKTTNQTSEAFNAISSSIIVTAYLLNHFQIANNYYALFEAWTCLAGSIVRYSYKLGLKEGTLIDSLNLIMSEITRNLSSLKTEILGREDFLEGNWMGDGREVYRTRATIVLGVLAALENHLKKTEGYTQDNKLLELIKNNIKTLLFFGEAAFPFFFNLIKYLELNNENEIAQSLLGGLFVAILEQNSYTNETGLANPYYSLNDILEAILQINKRKIDFHQFPGSSYVLETIIYMITRRNGREWLEKNWKKISHIQFEEFKVDNIEDTFAWRIEKGVNCSEFPKAPQSWSELVKLANNFDDVNALYVAHLNLLRFLLLVYPHRTNKTILGLLDTNVPPINCTI